MDELRSILTGTLGLTVMAVVALALTLLRGSRADPQSAPAVRRWALLGVVGHLLHFAEEWMTGFHVAFPALLGLPPWSDAFFVAFNGAWMLIWLLCALNAKRTGALFPLWFLALGSAVNGLAHPLMAVAAGGYFPGLWTSPLSGALGAILLRQLGRATTTT